MLALGHEGGADRRDALRRAAVHARRPARLPQLLVGRVPATRSPTRPSTSSAPRADRHDRAVAVAARALPRRRGGGAGDRRTSRCRGGTRPGCVHPFGLWDRPGRRRARQRAGARAMRGDLQPWASGAVYLNFIGDEGEDRIVAGFGRENYRRLAEVKATYDPENVFHLNHNIRPAEASARRGGVVPPGRSDRVRPLSDGARMLTTGSSGRSRRPWPSAASASCSRRCCAAAAPRRAAGQLRHAGASRPAARDRGRPAPAAC